MADFIINILSDTLAKILPSVIATQWEKRINQTWLKRPPKELLIELRYFLDITFPQNPPTFKDSNCRYLANSRVFFLEKVDILDSLEKDQNGSVGILCRVPWLLMPESYRDVYLDTTEARAYYAMLEKQARSGRLKYLYNLNALRNQDASSALIRGDQLNCYPMLLMSTSFDVMIIHTDRHRHKVIFATRPVGYRDQEVGIVIEQKDLYLVLNDYFESFWVEARRYWKQEIENGTPSLTQTFRYLQP